MKLSRSLLLIGTALLLCYSLNAQLTSGPCSRRSSIVLSEIHYHPPGEAIANREFIELYNSSPISVDLSGWKLRGDADYDFPEGTKLEGNQFLIVAADPSLFASEQVAALGPWAGTLSNGGGRVRLRKASGGIVLETNYKDNTRWPTSADGAGHSLILQYPSYGESRREAWAPSYNHGGSPGDFDPISTDALDQIIISEIRANSEGEAEDFVEFHNPGPIPADLSNCLLSQNPSFDGYKIPEGTIIAPGDYRSFAGNIAGFDFDRTGDSIILRAPDGLRVIGHRRFTGQAEDRPWGGITRWRELSRSTPRLRNATEFHDPLVINEIHYHPIGDTNNGEYLELLNQGPDPIDLSGWKLKDGINFTFPTTTIGPGKFLVIAKDRDTLLSLHPGLDPGTVLGNFSGSLSNRSDRIELENTNNRIVDEVTYFDGGRWPSEADGGGSSLQLRDPRSDNNAPSNWRAPDESTTAQSIVVEHTGVLDFGHRATAQATRFFIMLHGAGEAIIDDIEVLVNGSNLISNACFNSNLNGWNRFGTHGPTFAEDGVMRLIATNEGDQANLVETNLTTPIPPGTQVTIRATCRWVAGTPDILLGLNGGYIEAPGKLPVPASVGTPGAVNEETGNTGPTITEVTHFPLLPQAGDPITIRARITDPDAVLSARVRYRIDPNSSLSQIVMTDAGDDFYTAKIPAQPAGTLIEFHLITIDNAVPKVIANFPKGAPQRGCLVRVGSRNEDSDFSTMHLWATNDTLVEWRDRPRSSNLELDVTFVSEGRAFYNVGAYYAGSQNGVSIYDSPVGNPTGYNIKIPDDEVFLNVQNLTIDRETTRDPTRQRERLLFWFLEKLKLPNLHRRYVHFFFNGIERDQLIMESVQKPNREIMEQWFKDEGRLTKTAPWWEFDGNNKAILSAGTERNLLRHLFSEDGSIKLPHHRWTWIHGAGHDDGNDFSGIIDLIDAAQAPADELFKRMNEKADMRQWMRTFAMNDLGSFWDTFGNQANKNAYLFESLETGKSSIVIWDMDVGLGVFNDPVTYPLFHPNVDPNVQRLFDQPGLVRDYWQALDESLDSFFTASDGSDIQSILEETYDALVANDAAVTSPFVPSGRAGLAVDDWINQRRSFIQNELNGKDSGFSVSAPASSQTQFVEITGTLPLATTKITANGIPLAPDYSTITNFTADLALQPGSNEILIEALDQGQTPLGASILNITFTGTSQWADLKINEWMAANPATTGILDPVDQNAEDWIEIHNPTTAPVSLDGWHLSDDPTERLKFPIPDGFIIPANGFILIWADNEPLQNAPTLRQEIHTNFKISAAGESILLTAPDTSKIDEVSFADQTPGIARLRTIDGSDLFTYSLSPTPGQTNGIPPDREAVKVAIEFPIITFPSNPGEVYEMQISSDLAIWKTLDAPIAGNGNALGFSIPTGNFTQFFRIVTH